MSAIGEVKIGDSQTASTPRSATYGEPLGDPLEVADPVAVRILERPRIDLVHHRPAPPVAHPRLPPMPAPDPSPRRGPFQARGVHAVHGLCMGCACVVHDAFPARTRFRTSSPVKLSLGNIPPNGPFILCWSAWSHDPLIPGYRGPRAGKPAPAVPLRRHHPPRRGQPQRLRGDPPLRRRERRARQAGRQPACGGPAPRDLPAQRRDRRPRPSRRRRHGADPPPRLGLDAARRPSWP